MEGKGTFKFKNGNIYEGEWKNDKSHGTGTYKFKNGNVYTGEFKGGKRDGLGTFLYPDGEKYVGDYKNGKRTGQGVYTFKNGNTYDGEFWDGVKMERVLSNILMVIFTKVNGKMTCDMVRVSLVIHLVVIMMENGKMAS